VAARAQASCGLRFQDQRIPVAVVKRKADDIAAFSCHDPTYCMEVEGDSPDSSTQARVLLQQFESAGNEESKAAIMVQLEKLVPVIEIDYLRAHGLYGMTKTTPNQLLCGKLPEGDVIDFVRKRFNEYALK
jgi:hypothetical protein